MKEQQHNWNNSNAQVQVIAPGLVFIKGALDEEQQKWLTHYALDAGSREEKGFWLSSTVKDEQTGEEKVVKVLNSDAGRGRIYDDVEHFPDSAMVQELCHTLVNSARERDDRMPQMQPTHLLLLYYATEDGMEWHSDRDPNDGSNDHPIVSITIGNACDFGYKLVGKPEQTIRLESGDVLIWGGPNRMLYHCVQRVHANSVPSFLQELLGNVRLNFTYRDAPEVRGRENEFKYNISGFNVSA